MNTISAFADQAPNLLLGLASFVGLTVLPFLLLMGTIVFMHELGHYLAARWSGITVKDFSIGLGRAIWQRQGRHNTWTIRLLPIGGFVRVPEEGPGSLGEASTLTRIGFVAAGPAVNFVFAIVFFTFAFMSGLGFTPNRIESVVENGPAFTAGLRAGDRITAINGVGIRSYDDIMVGSQYGLPTQTDIITVARTGPDGTTTLSQPVTRRDNRYGIKFQKQFATGPLSAMSMAGEQMLASMWSLVHVPLLVSANGGDPATIFSGPVGIASVTGDVVRSPNAWLVTLQLIALLNVGLGVFNLLPLPVLDGGRLLIYAIEGIARRRTPARLQHFMAGASLVIILTAGTFITAKDISDLLVN